MTHLFIYYSGNDRARSRLIAKKSTLHTFFLHNTYIFPDLVFSCCCIAHTTFLSLVGATPTCVWVCGMGRKWKNQRIFSVCVREKNKCRLGERLKVFKNIKIFRFHRTTTPEINSHLNPQEEQLPFFYSIYATLYHLTFKTALQ